MTTKKQLPHYKHENTNTYTNTQFIWKQHENIIKQKKQNKGNRTKHATQTLTNDNTTMNHDDKKNLINTLIRKQVTRIHPLKRTHNIYINEINKTYMKWERERENVYFYLAWTWLKTITSYSSYHNTDIQKDI